MLLVKSLAYRPHCKYLLRSIFYHPPTNYMMATSAVSGTAAHELPERAHAVLSYWFGDNYSAHEPGYWAPAEKEKLWWRGGEAVDQYVKANFGADVEAMAAGAYDEWLAQPYSALAGIILADQFTRNMYRGTAQAFSLDSKALSWSRQLQDSGLVKELPPALRSFVNTPFMHSEQLEDQQRCVDVATAEYESNKAQDPESPATKAWQNILQFAIAHRDVIAKWGRFPHRNAILGRQSTPEEVAGLADGSIGKW